MVVVEDPPLGVFLGLRRNLAGVFLGTVDLVGAFSPRPQLLRLHLERPALLELQPPVLCSEEVQGLLCLSPLEVLEEFLVVVEDQVVEALCLEVDQLEDRQSLEEEQQQLQVEPPAQCLEGILLFQPLGGAVCLEEDLQPVHLVSQVCLDKLQYLLLASLEPLLVPQSSLEGEFLEQQQAPQALFLEAQARKPPAQGLCLGKLLLQQLQALCLAKSHQPLLLQAPFSANLLLQLQDQAQYLDNPQQPLPQPLFLASQLPRPLGHCLASSLQLTLQLDSQANPQAPQVDFSGPHLSPHPGQVDFLAPLLNPLPGVFLGLLQLQAVAGCLVRLRSL